MSSIHVEHLRKVFGKTVAVQDVNLQIEDKELVVLLGPSGCGKTTTLNCIAGLEKPTSGRIYFDTKDVTDIPPHERNVAMVFQSALLYPHLTGRENILMSLRVRKLPPHVVKERLSKVTALLDIEHLMDKLPSQMSGGERQRVAMAKAIVRNPSVFLMDEPLASLDAALRESLRAELLALQKELEATMVFVTHDQVEAMTLGDRIAVMRKGIIHQVGSPDALYNYPIDVFVAGFIGSPPTQFFDGYLTATEKGIEFSHEHFSLLLSGKLGQLAKDVVGGQRVILGVRPQYIKLSTVPRASDFACTVYAVERLGKETVVTVQTMSGKKVKAVVSPDFPISMGEKVFLNIDPEHIFLFDADTGTNVLMRGEEKAGGT